MVGTKTGAGRPRTLKRWLKSTSNRTFIVYPVLIFAVEAVLNGGWPATTLWWSPLLAWGYLQYRLSGAYRTRIGGGGPGMDNPPERIVDSGIYGYTRNPMYAGHLIFMTGLAATFNSAVATVLMVAHIPWFHRRALRDERHLSMVFGDAYRDYRARVRRWVPYVL